LSRTVLLAYQLLTGISDTCTGALLIIAPALALGLMHVDVPVDSLIYVSYIGSFVLAVGLCCLYGARLVIRRDPRGQLATVWLLTALIRLSVAVFVAVQISTGSLAPRWISVAGFDGLCFLIQAVGLQKNWTVVDGSR